MKKWLIALLLLTVLSVSFAQSDEQLTVEHYTLDNGLEVILVQDASAPTVAVDVWYNVGGAYDPEGKSGFAHLFEHLMFEGSPNLPEGGIDNIVTSGGGYLNAYTDIDITAYYEAMPSHQLPVALWLEADRMAGLPITQVNLDNQRAIVIEELQLRVANSPYGQALQDLFTIPYSYEPYKRRVIGSIEDINAARVDDVKDFHRTYYLPNNATLVVAGDIDFDTARGLIDDLFAPIPAGDEPPTLPDFVPAEQDEPEFYTVEDPLINLPAILIGYETPPRESDDYPAIELLARILSVGDSSRLAQKLLDTGKAIVADSVVFSNRGPSLFGVLLLPNMGVTIEEVEQVFYDELQLILDEGVPQEELDKAIALIRSGKLLELETSFGLAESVQAANYFFGDPQAVFTEIERYEGVTSEDIQRVLGEYLAPEDRHVINVVQSDAAPPAPVEPFVDEDAPEVEPDYRYVIKQTTPPEPLDVNEFTLPNITETTLENGLQVIVVEQPGMPIISLDLVLPGGGSATDPELAGLAGMTGALMSRGTTNRTAQELAGTIEQVGGSLGSDGGADSLIAGVFALIEDTELAFELLGDMILNANFPESEVEREREASISALEANLAEPSYVADRTFSSILYDGHPYGSLVTFDSLTAITRDDIVAFYESQKHPDGAFLIVAGDITADEAIEYATATFGDWQGESAPPAYPELADTGETHIYLVDRPGSTQADFIIGNIGAEGDSPDFFPIRVMNEVFGGTFASRLSQNIREDKGYTYGIYSSFDFPADAGSFSVSAAVRNDVIDLAIQEVLNEIERIQTEPFTEQELADSKSGIVGRFALGLETYQDFVDAISSYLLRGVSLERLTTYPQDMDAVTADDVLAVANTYIQPENLVIVVVGDASEIQEKLEAIAPVTLVESE